MPQGSPKKHLRQKWAAMAHGHKSTEVEAHEASVTCNHDPLGLAIRVDQTGRGVGLERSNGLLLLGCESPDRLDLLHQRAHDGAYVVIEDRREIRVSIPGQKRLKRWRMRQSVSGLTVENGSRERGDVWPGNQIAVNIGVVKFEVRMLLVAKRVVRLGTNLLLGELERAIGLVCLSIEAVNQFGDGRLQGCRIIHFENCLPPRRR